MAFIAAIPPPSIHHLPARPPNYAPMVKQAAANIHLRQQSTQLLLCYARQADGFKPAQGFIEKKTSIPAKKVSDVRARLVKRGLICYDKESHKIYIAWDRIRAFAILDKPLLLTRGKCTFFPFDPTPYLNGTVKRNSFIKQHRLVPVPLTLEQARQLRVLQTLPLDEFREFITLGS